MPYFQLPEQSKYKYELTKNEQFSYESLSSDSQEVFEVLREFGAKVVYCRYNGGYDEGFAQFDKVELEDRTINLNDLKPQLLASSLVSKTTEYLCSYYGTNQPSPEQRIDFFMELFADELAIALLGGYGTGEYSIKGSFKANLETGEIIDQQE